MGLNIGTATAYLDLDASKFNRSIKDVQASVKDMTGKFGNVNKTMSDGIGKFLNEFDKMPTAFKGVGPLAAAMGTTIVGAFKLGSAGAKEFTQDAMFVGDAFLSMGKVGVSALGTVAKTGMEFEQTMAQVKGITGATDKEFANLTRSASEWGMKTKFSSTEVAEAMTYMGMAGWKTTDIMDGLGGVLGLATVGGTDLARTSDIVTDGLTAMGLSARDAGRFADLMTATITNSNTNVEMLGETLKYVGPIAGSLGVEMDDLSVAIGLMGNAGKIYCSVAEKLAA